ncbi:MAG TPA: ABC transporter substrate-binding protein [Roseococcus sp.]|jgi:peptide/nickel transport system substrate-binding protein|nr:ABC transporter substrate-binding protein [Roseococcus sp.]
MLNRRSFLGTAAAAPLLAAPAAMAQNRARVLRYVPSSNLTVLDPVFTPASVSITHGYCVFDTLYGVDARMRPQPQMAAGHSVSDDGLTWEITLREGLRFHDGEPVRARDCAASLERWSRRDSFGQALGAATESFGFKDDRTIVIKLKRRFGRLLDAIAKPHSSPAMIMPERLARTSPTTQVTEMVGSGPYRFVAGEYVSGSRMIYEKFAGYVPRQEAPAWTSGGKVVHFDRMEWHVLPDPATAAAALQAGEVDWLATALPDLVPAIARNRQLRLFRGDPFGVLSVLRFNHLHAPFDKVAVRQAVLRAVEQLPFIQAITARPEDGEVCRSMFPCGMPGVTEVGEGVMGTLDATAARRALAEAGYNGERIVILNPTDIATINAHSLLVADLLRRIGMNVDMQSMDWGTVVQRRISKNPIERGGWSLACTNWPAISIDNPATNATTRGQGDSGWWGWFADARTEELVQEWLGAATPEEASATFLAAQRRALEMVPSVPLGRTFSDGAMRANLQGALEGSVQMFWNVRRA